MKRGRGEEEEKGKRLEERDEGGKRGMKIKKIK